MHFGHGKMFDGRHRCRLDVVNVMPPFINSLK